MNVILSEAKNLDLWQGGRPRFFVASLLRMTESTEVAEQAERLEKEAAKA